MAPPPDQKSVTLVSNDGHRMNFNSDYINKCVHISTMLQALNYDVAKGHFPKEAIKVDVKKESLEVIREWLRLHESEEPKTDRERALDRFCRKIPEEDTALFDKLEPRDRLADVINSASYLDMPDMLDSLQKYTANSLEKKGPREIAAWLDVKYME
ncbi:hypothetical protein QR680_014457 [Steinernema hermaphroditum]|uniref:SKP1 component POZ domain-containing protein n=1 Tax=Steinernema hermaphroditum TaxID=289476 RepID=A0AA39I8Y8_9BILA|nr:hypothetical protein QR680_014457 [Steinernema hermaphroditum]